MRLLICCITMCATGIALVGCGQSGALHLPNDPNYDKRAKYLLYPNVDPKNQPAPQQPVTSTTESNSSTSTP